MILRWAIPSAAGATNDKKSDGVIQAGTARTPSITHSDPVVSLEAEASSSSFEGAVADSRKT